MLYTRECAVPEDVAEEAFTLAIRLWQRAQAEALYWRLQGQTQLALEAAEAGRIWQPTQTTSHQ